MAQSRAVLESAPGECFTSAAGTSFEESISALEGTLAVAGAGEGAGVAVGTALPMPSISMIGLMLDIMAGSFAISSGFDKSEERISPPPELTGAVPLLAGGGAEGGAESFCRIEERISSCIASLALFSF